MKYLLGLLFLLVTLSGCMGTDPEIHFGFSNVSGGGEGLPGLLAAAASKQVLEASVQNNDCAVSERWTQGVILRSTYHEVAEYAGTRVHISAGSQQPTYVNGENYFTTRVVPDTAENTVPFRPSASSYFQFDGRAEPCPGAVR